LLPPHVVPPPPKRLCQVSAYLKKKTQLLSVNLLGQGLTYYVSVVVEQSLYSIFRLVQINWKAKLNPIMFGDSTKFN
jgi:hypothetical protein